MTNAEKREHRRQAARKGAAARAARVVKAERQADEFQALADRINGFQGATPPEAPQPPRLEDKATADRKAEAREARRPEQLRAVIRRAQEIRRESDLYHHAHSLKWHHSPKRWTQAQIDEARKFVEGFVSPDGIPQADPIKRKGKARL